MRHIVRIDIKNNALVKGINLEGLRVIGDPISAAELYFGHGCQELFIVDVVASLYGRNAIKHVIQTISQNVFIPITVAGGIGNQKDVETLLNAGADRVAINSGFVNDPCLINRLVNEFGSSTICGMIEGVKLSEDDIRCFTCSGREETSLDIFEWANRLESEGVGEIIYTDVISEGTGNGIDLSTIDRLTSNLYIPVVSNGGVGKLSDIQGANAIEKLSGISAASAVHYNYLNDIKADSAVLGNSQMRLSRNVPSFIHPFTISEFNTAEMKN